MSRTKVSLPEQSRLGKMDNRLEEVMAAYNSAYLSMVASNYGGDATINEVRVMNCVFRSHLAKTNIGVTCISKALAIPKSTVSRAVLNLRADGWIREENSLCDGRRIFLRLTSKLLDRFSKDKVILQSHWPKAA